MSTTFAPARSTVRKKKHQMNRLMIVGLSDPLIRWTAADPLIRVR
jgi:hypothetical protein